MEIYIRDSRQELYDIDKLQLLNTSVALGTFDAMHLGHTAIIKRAVKDAKEHGRISAVSMFLNIPSDIISHKHIKPIYSFEDKCRILEEMGVDVVLAERFTESYMKKTYTEFFREHLIEKLGAKFLAVGFNYHFGSGGRGNVQKLEELCRNNNINLFVQPCMRLENVISSTHIRKLLADGNVDKAAEYLGRYFALSGEVVHGNGCGNSFGFPTANTEIPSEIPLRFGVYITQTYIDKKWYPSVTNIGTKPTVDGQNKNMESHILDFEGDLYGKKVTVRFIKFLRDIQKFQSVDDLIAQVKRDKNIGREYFSKYIGGGNDA